MTSERKKFKENEKNLRIVPMNIEAEQALLAALLTSNSVYERISDFLRPEQFYDDINGKIFEAIAKLLENNQLADPLTLKNYFLQKDATNPVGNFHKEASTLAKHLRVPCIENYWKKQA